MRTPSEAIGDILCRIESTTHVDRVPLAQALRRVLARDAVADVDLPPFEKSAMDGFAVRSTDFVGPNSPRRLRRIGESKAGAPFEGTLQPGECVEIYTGAELPRESDAVVMVEHSKNAGEAGEHILLEGSAPRGQHVCHVGEDLRSGATVLMAGRRLSPIDLSVLAAVGCQPVPVFRRPRVALLTTGDELVAADAKPARGQIREGNTFYLAAALAAAGADVTNHGIVPDDEAVLTRRFEHAFEASDALVTTGGVSMGRYDLVGTVFERLGVENVFHKVAIKPGKPLWFGLRRGVPVFALPGNPVSCLIGFEVFVRRALSKLEGADASEWEAERLRIGLWTGHEVRSHPRQQNLPVRVIAGEDGLDRLEPLAWKSSADIVGLTRAQGLAVVAAERTLSTGERVEYRPL